MQNTEIWATPQNFRRYSVSNFGRVYDFKRDKMSPVRIVTGLNLAVNLVRDDGIRQTKLIKRLVAELFVDYDHDKNYENLAFPPIFNTVVQLDNNFDNVHADNLKWRTKDFAWHYKKQFRDLKMGVDYIVDTCKTRCMDQNTGIIYETLDEAAMHLGILFSHLRKQVIIYPPEFGVFPIDHIFARWCEFEQRFISFQELWNIWDPHEKWLPKSILENLPKI